MKLISIGYANVDDWSFKMTMNKDECVIMIHAYNSEYQWSQLRFFNRIESAECWADYLIMQTEHTRKNT